MRVANSSNLDIGDTIEAILRTDGDRMTESAVERDWRPIRCAAWMAISPDIFEGQMASVGLFLRYTGRREFHMQICDPETLSLKKLRL